MKITTLNESIENIEAAFSSGIDPVLAVDLVLADAYKKSQEAKEHVEEVVDELDKKAEDVILDTPEAKLPMENEYTKQLKLDESIEDFRLQEDGRKNRVAARDENDTDLYLDYDMMEFVYELLSSGSKGITNIAPKTPTVHRRKTSRSPIEELPMKKFSPNGSQVIDKELVYLLDLAPSQSAEIRSKIARLPMEVSELIKRYATKADGNTYMAEEVFDSLCAKLGSFYDKVGRDVIGYAFLNNIKTLSSPQISEAGNKIVVYSDDLDDFTQAAEGLMYYGITCEAPKTKRNKTSHWDYSMVVNVPCYSDGEPMILEDWLEENNLTIDDVMDEKVAKRFKKNFAKADKASNEVTKKVIYDKYITKAFRDGSLDLDDVYAEMCNELAQHGIECDAKLKKKFDAEFEETYEDDLEEE